MLEDVSPISNSSPAARMYGQGYSMLTARLTQTQLWEVLKSQGEAEMENSPILALLLYSTVREPLCSLGTR